MLIKSIYINAALTKIQSTTTCTLPVSLSIPFLPHNTKTMPHSSSSSSPPSSVSTISNLRLRALIIWSSKNYAIAAFVFLLLFSLTLFSHLDSRSRSPYPSHPRSSLVPLTLLRNANRTRARTFLTPPRVSVFRLNWIPNFHLCVCSLLGRERPRLPFPKRVRIRISQLVAPHWGSHFAFVKFGLFSRIEKNWKHTARKIFVYGKQFLKWKIWRKKKTVFL